MLRRIENYLNKVVSPISRVFGNISMVLIILVILLVIVDVCLRRFFDSPLRGANELVSLAFSIIVFFSLAWCALNDGHIEVDFVVNKFPKTTRLIIETIMIFLTAAILGLMSWRMLVYGTMMRASNMESGLLEIIIYPFIYLAALGCLLVALAFIIRFLRLLSDITEGRR